MGVNLRLVSLPLLGLSLVVLLVVVVVYSTTGGNIPFDYGIVLDAGSSHTEVILYKWMGDKLKDTGIVHEVDSCTTGGGIDDHEDKVETTLDDLMPCITNITKNIDFDKKGSTPLYLGATAGMRVLELKKPLVTKYIFKAIENEILRYKDEHKTLDVKQIKILDGKEEGLFGWISGNYLLKRFPQTDESKATKTSGILDMGGASAQIAYQIEAGKLPETKVASTRLFGVDYTVRSTSNLCFGGDEARMRHLALLIMENPSKTMINDPCLFRDASRTFMGSKFEESVCMLPKDGDPLYYDRSLQYIFRGAPNIRDCTALVTQLLDLEHCKSKFKHCFTVEATPPPADMDFAAVSSYYYDTQVLDTVVATKSISYDNYLKETKAFCDKNWKDVDVESDRYDRKFVINFCFLLHYIQVTLEKVYKFEKNQWENIRFLKKIDGQGLGWAQGMMINATNALPAEQPSARAIATPWFIALLCLCLVVAAAGIVMFKLFKK